MKRTLFTLLIVLLVANICEAAPRKKNYGYTTNTAFSTTDNSTAQGVANTMAARNYVGHFGGNSGYEGCGSGYSREQAYNNCCFANDTRLTTVDVGYAQGSNGRWFCCRRYR
jgi:hypothetical protein